MAWLLSLRQQQIRTGKVFPCQNLLAVSMKWLLPWAQQLWLWLSNNLWLSKLVTLCPQPPSSYTCAQCTYIIYTHSHTSHCPSYTRTNTHIIDTTFTNMRTHGHTHIHTYIQPHPQWYQTHIPTLTYTPTQRRTHHKQTTTMTISTTSTIMRIVSTTTITIMFTTGKDLIAISCSGF